MFWYQITEILQRVLYGHFTLACYQCYHYYDHPFYIIELRTLITVSFVPRSRRAARGQARRGNIHTR